MKIDTYNYSDIFDDHPIKQTERQVKLDEIRQALKRGEFKAYYQPQLNMQDGTIYGAEVLARWEHLDHGVLPPAAFIALFESRELIDILSSQLFEQGCGLLQNLKSNNQPFSLSFNLHPIQSFSTELLANMKDFLSKYQISGTDIVIELTEPPLPITGKGILTAFNDLGFTLSLDDIGTGYSSLKRLCELPVKEIKIDGQFVRGMHNGVNCKIIVETIITLANRLGIRCVAEGIEHAKQYFDLVDMGCNAAQGYWISKPLPPHDLLKFLSSNSLQLKSV